MNSYNRIYDLLTEEVPSKKSTRASKKTQAATNKAKKKEADSNIKKFTGGTYKQRRGK